MAQLDSPFESKTAFLSFLASGSHYILEAKWECSRRCTRHCPETNENGHTNMYVRMRHAQQVVLCSAHRAVMKHILSTAERCSRKKRKLSYGFRQLQGRSNMQEQKNTGLDQIQRGCHLG